MSSQARKFYNFLKVFKRSRRGTLGIIILSIFVFIAVAAPLLTPFDPKYDEELAGTYSSPSLFRYLPGGQNLTENYLLINKPGFDNPISLKEWTFEMMTNPPNPETPPAAQIDYTKEYGKTRNGSMLVEFRQTADSLVEETNTTVSKTFYYPFTGSPKRFGCPIALWVKSLSNAHAEIKVFIERLGERRYDLWTKGFTAGELTWVEMTPVDSQWQPIQEMFTRIYNQSQPPVEVFRKPGDYKFGVQIRFSPIPNQNAEATIIIDDLNLRLFGTAFGLLGTEYRGRDIFSQLVHGTRISLMVGLLSAVVSVVIGLILGLLSGYLGKIADEVIMRFSDLLLVLPTLPLLLVLVSVVGSSIWNVVFLIGVLGWMGFARVVRAQVLTLRERPFVEAAKAVGAGKFHIIGTHILPNVVSLIYVTLALSVPGAIISEAALSWLGLYDPSVVSWGRMLYDIQQEQAIKIWWWVIPPGISIALVSISFILIGYALDEIFNPKLRIRR